MSELILYRPYASNIWSVVLTFSSGVLAVILNIFFPLYLLSILAIVMFLMTLIIYHDYSIVIAFTNNEIQVFERKANKTYLWADFNNAYYSRCFKGFPYLILSNKELNLKQVRALCNKCYFSTKNICLDGILVIYINGPDEAKIKEMKNIKSLNIHNLL